MFPQEFVSFCSGEGVDEVGTPRRRQVGTPCYWHLVANLDVRPGTPRTTSSGGHWSTYARYASGRYASYWNAFLFILKLFNFHQIATTLLHNVTNSLPWTVASSRNPLSNSGYNLRPWQKTRQTHWRHLVVTTKTSYTSPPTATHSLTSCSELLPVQGRGQASSWLTWRSTGSKTIVLCP